MLDFALQNLCLWRYSHFFTPTIKKKSKKRLCGPPLNIILRIFWLNIFFVSITQEALGGGVPSDHSGSILVFQSFFYICGALSKGFENPGLGMLRAPAGISWIGCEVLKNSWTVPLNEDSCAALCKYYNILIKSVIISHVKSDVCCRNISNSFW